MKIYSYKSTLFFNTIFLCVLLTQTTQNIEARTIARTELGIIESHTNLLKNESLKPQQHITLMEKHGFDNIEELLSPKSQHALRADEIHQLIMTGTRDQALLDEFLALPHRSQGYSGHRTSAERKDYHVHVDQDLLFALIPHDVVDYLKNEKHLRLMVLSQLDKVILDMRRVRNNNIFFDFLQDRLVSKTQDYSMQYVYLGRENDIVIGVGSVDQNFYTTLQNTPNLIRVNDNIWDGEPKYL